MEVEIMDTQILNARRQLSPELAWDAEKMIDYAVAGETEPNLRRRLHIYTVREALIELRQRANCLQRLNLLRMLIRQNPLQQ